MCKLQTWRERNATSYLREHQILNCHCSVYMALSIRPILPQFQGASNPQGSGHPSPTGAAVTRDTPVPALPVASVHSPFSCLSLRVPAAAGSCQVPLSFKSSLWWAQSSPGCAAVFVSSALRCACCLQQCPTHRHSLHCHRSSSTNCSGMDSGGFGLCDHRAEGSAALFGDAAAPPTLQPSTHLRCCPEKSISLPSLPFPS